MRTHTYLAGCLGKAFIRAYFVCQQATMRFLKIISNDLITMCELPSCAEWNCYYILELLSMYMNYIHIQNRPPNWLLNVFLFFYYVNAGIKKKALTKPRSHLAAQYKREDKKVLGLDVKCWRCSLLHYSKCNIFFLRFEHLWRNMLTQINILTRSLPLWRLWRRLRFCCVNSLLRLVRLSSHSRICCRWFYCKSDPESAEKFPIKCTHLETP